MSSVFLFLTHQLSCQFIKIVHWDYFSILYLKAQCVRPIFAALFSVSCSSPSFRVSCVFGWLERRFQSVCDKFFHWFLLGVFLPRSLYMACILSYSIYRCKGFCPPIFFFSFLYCWNPKIIYVIDILNDVMHIF